MSIALSVFSLSGMVLPPRRPSSAVMTKVDFAVDDAAGQRVRRKAAEDDRVDRADARAGQHRIGRLRDHRHVDGDAVAFLDAVLLHHIGEPADMLVQLVVGDLLVVVGVVAFPDDGDLVAALLQMPVDAIVGDIGQPVLEPFDRDLALERGVLDLGVGLEPVDALAVLAPELVRVLDALGVPFEIGVVVDQRALLPRRLNLVNVHFRHFLALPPDHACAMWPAPPCRHLLSAARKGNIRRWIWAADVAATDSVSIPHAAKPLCSRRNVAVTKIQWTFNDLAAHFPLGGQAIELELAAMRDLSETELMLKGYGLTTAKILYHFPDHPHLLQTLSGRTTTSRRTFRC